MCIKRIIWGENHKFYRPQAKKKMFAAYQIKKLLTAYFTIIALFYTYLNLYTNWDGAKYQIKCVYTEKRS